MSRPSVITSVVAGSGSDPFSHMKLPGQAYSLLTTTTTPSPNCAGTAHTDGSFTSIGAATSRRYDAVEMWVGGQASGRRFMAELGVDPAGGTSYSAVGYHMPIDSPSSTGEAWNRYIIPANVPSGSTLAVRCRNGIDATVTNILVVAYGINYTTAPAAYPTLTEIGFTLASTRMTTIDPGVSINTFSGWTQLVASSAASATAFIPVVGHFDTTNFANATYVIEIGTGAAASEVTVGAVLDRQDGNTKVTGFAGAQPIPFPSTVAAGTRISARVMSSSNVANSRKVDIGLVLVGGL